MNAVRRKEADIGRIPLSRVDQARIAALRGDVEEALVVLTEIAETEDDDRAAGASASLAEMLAYLGRWDEVVLRAAKLIANPLAVYAGNVLIDMILLVGRAGRETGRWTDIAAMAGASRTAVSDRLAANPEGYPETKIEALRGSMLVPIDRLGEYARGQGQARRHDNVNLFLPESRPPNPASYEAMMAKNRRAPLSRQMTFARLSRMDDEMIRLAAALGGQLDFDQGVALAQVLSRRGDLETAGSTIERAWPEWVRVDRSQVAPVSLLTDDALTAVMTRERCVRLLSMPRAAYTWS